MAAGDVVLETAEALAVVGVTGYAPHSCAIIPFGGLKMHEDFFPSNSFGDIKLKLTGESAAGAIKVLISQLRK